jgi:chromosome segregation ATPase
MAEKVQSLNAGNRAAILNVARDYFAQVSACLGVEYRVVVGQEVQCQRRTHEEDNARREAQQELASLREEYVTKHVHSDGRIAQFHDRRGEINKELKALYDEQNDIERRTSEIRTAFVAEWSLSDEYKKAKAKVQKALDSKLVKVNQATTEVVKRNNRTMDLTQLFNEFKEQLAFSKTAPEAQERLNQVKKALDKLNDKYKNDIETL